MFPTNVYAEHIFDDAYAQYLDISQLESEKVVMTFDDVSYDLYYGFHGSLDAMGTDYDFPTLSSMTLNEERKSLEITLDEVPEMTDFWVRMPEDVIYAENENFVVLVDGIDTRYDLMKFPNDYVIGFLITEETRNVEIIGTEVIPEFGSITIIVLALSVVVILLLPLKSKLYFLSNTKF